MALSIQRAQETTFQEAIDFQLALAAQQQEEAGQAEIAAREQQIAEDAAFARRLAAE